MQSSSKTELVLELKRLRAKQRVIQECPYYFYTPWGDQINFERSGARIRLLKGGNRSGKSTEGVAEDIAFAKGFRHNGDKTNIPPPPTKGLILFTRREKVAKVFIPKLESFVAKGWISHIKNGHDGYPECITWSNGSVQWIGAYTQDPKTFESDDWDYVHFDEPPSRAIFVAATRGLIDRGGRCWFTLTPLSCPWIYNELQRKADGVNIAVFKISLWDNPYISREFKEDFANSLHPDERKARMDGEFSHLAGAIFPEFSREKHVVPAHLPPVGRPIYMVMDPHDRRPSAMSWWYIDQRDRKICFAEWPNRPFWEIKSVNMSVRDYSNVIRDVEGRWRIQDRLMDPNFGQTRSHMTGTTLVDEYWEYGLVFNTDFDNGPGSIQVGHNRIHEALSTENRDPEILICDNCQNMIWAFESYSWNQSDMDAEFNARERPGDEGKDQIDNVRYLFAAEPTGELLVNQDEQPFTAADLGRGYG